MGVTAPEVLAAAVPSRPFAVKDSFSRLDLAPTGFSLLGEASWIACEDGPAGLPDHDLTWGKVNGLGELGIWARFQSAENACG